MIQRLHFQLRVFLIHFFVEFSKSTTNKNLSGWAWASWLRYNFINLGFVINFNYDTIFEQALLPPFYLEYSNIIPLQFMGSASKIEIFKPHGSINFGYRQLVDFGNPEMSIYESDMTFLINDFPVNLLKTSNLSSERSNADIVLPGEMTKIREFQNVVVGYGRLKLRSNQFRKCIIAGISYWDVDRPEINEIIDDLPPHCEIKIVNPTPPSDLIRYLEDRGRIFSVHDFIPPNI